MANGIAYGPLGLRCVHLCADMQRLFAEPTEWHTPWMDRVRPVVATDALCSSSDTAHDASMNVYHTRYGQQVETATADLVLEAW